MEPQPPNAKQEAGSARGAERSAGGQIARPAPRRYPKPPAFWPRMLMLCVRPESWAETARYPTFVTLLPLMVVIVLGAMAATAGQTVRQVRAFQEFQATYDQRYPPMELSSEGVLSVKGELKAPVRVPVPGGVVLVDPTGRTNPATIQAENLVGVITDRNLVQVNPITHEHYTESLAKWIASTMGVVELPKKGEAKVINGATIREFARNRMPYVVSGVALWAIAQAVGEAAWAALMIFLVSPLIMLVAASRIGAVEGAADRRSRMLLLPRRAVYRMAAGLLVPLVMLSAVLRTLGHPVDGVLGTQGATMFWFLAAGGLAVWTGLMARRMYGGRKA